MPRVPSYDDFQVAANVLPAERVSMPSMPDVAGQQAQQFGQSMQRFGGALGEIAQDIASLANQLRVDDALNQAKEETLRLAYDRNAGFLNLKGLDALQRPDGKPLADEYAARLKERLDAIAGGLGNDEQRRLFALRANDLLTAFRGQAMQHEAQEFARYSLSVSEGVINTALREIGLRWNDPVAADEAVQRIRAEVFRQGKLLGKSAEWQEAQARKQISNARKVALLAALENNDPAYAEAYLKKYAEQMDADDILVVRGHITKAMDAQIAFAAASDALTKMQPRIQVGETERAFNILLQAESGGRQFGPDGKPLTSSKGAVGIAQVMPATAPEAAKLAGLPWDENRYKNDPDYNRALGLAYFQKLLQDYSGDLAKAYAAYNAGPGRLQKAIREAADATREARRVAALSGRGFDGSPLSWLDFLPQETRDYVARNMKAFEAGQGQPSRPTFEEIDAALRSDPRLAGNPARYKIAREEAERQFNERVKAIKQREEEAVANAMRAIIANGGRWTDLPVSVRAAVPPKEVDSLINFAQKIAKGDDSTNLWLYNKLASNPDALAKMSDDAFFALRKELSDADFKHFANERAKRLGVASAGGAGDLNTEAIKRELDARLRMLNIDPTPKDWDTAGIARLGAIRRFVDQYFLAAQREAGKKFTDAEVAQHLDELFAKNATFHNWFSTWSGPMLAMKASNIDDETKNRIKAAFKRQGIDDPTDAQILNAYWNLKIVRR